MMVKTSKNRELTDDILRGVTEFHGHGGPFLILGVRMGILALRLLDAQGWFDLRCSVSLPWRPPDSCVIDGIQYSTGCTMGKHNIEVEEKEGIAADFNKMGEHVRIILRKEIIEKIRNTLAEDREEAVKVLITDLVAASDKDIFVIS